MDQDTFQALLQQLREEFLVELPERCNTLDELILKMEKNTANREMFNELFRAVHSLKGLGGTHGLSIITTLCHQLENLLTDTDAKNEFNSEFASTALAYVDLLRRIGPAARDEKSDYSAIEAELDELRCAMLKSRKRVLIAESSSTMCEFYKHALADLPLQLQIEDNGLSALARLLHESFDLVIVGREIRELNGLALVSALRASKTRNQDIPAILISSSQLVAPEHIGFSAVISRDQQLAENLRSALQKITGSN